MVGGNFLLPTIALAADPAADSHVIHIPDFSPPPPVQHFDPCDGISAASEASVLAACAENLKHAEANLRQLRCRLTGKLLWYIPSDQQLRLEETLVDKIESKRIDWGAYAPSYCITQHNFGTPARERG
jgi:hypothetical protein